MESRLIPNHHHIHLRIELPTKLLKEGIDDLRIKLRR